MAARFLHPVCTPAFLLGLGNTLMTAFFALALAFALGVVLGLMARPRQLLSAAGGRFFPDAGKAGVYPFYGWVSTSGSPGL